MLSNVMGSPRTSEPGDRGAATRSRRERMLARAFSSREGMHSMPCGQQASGWGRHMQVMHGWEQGVNTTVLAPGYNR